MNWMDGFDTGLMTLRELSLVLKESDALAKKLNLRFKWKMHNGKPMGEILEGEKTIWATEYCSKQFHYAYAYMVCGIHQKLLEIQKKKDIERSKREEQEWRDKLNKAHQEYVLKNFYGDIRTED